VQTLNAELSMCEKCEELDDKIERYDRTMFGINDQ
jgi:ABC-type transporter lipoprotein component MlaA